MNNIIFDSVQTLLEQLAEDLRLMSRRDQISHISLSGGSTPNLLFDYLANSPYATNINWQQLHFWWGDERCVASTDQESNFGQCKQRLLDKISIPAENIHPIQGENDPDQEAIRYAQEINAHIAKVNVLPQFDWIMLGIGGDGHTASIFPGYTNYDDTTLTFVAKQPQSGQLRISKTAHLIEQSKRITYLVMGESKADIIYRINTQMSSNKRYPAAHISSQIGKTEYYLDADAAKLLTKGTNYEC